MNNKISFKHLLWMYLTQPLFGVGFKTLNPFRFWYLHSVSQLESCWSKSQLLELHSEHLAAEFLEGYSSQNYFPVKFNQKSELVQFLERCWEKDFNK
jgi:hypothetical protein